MRWIYLSPHFDDAVLSCGGLIADQQERIQAEVWTILAGIPESGPFSPLADLLHQRWGFADAAEAVRRRRDEDERALSMLLVKGRYFPFLDCIYRRDAAGQPLYDAIFVPLHPAEQDLPQQIAQALQEHLGEQDVVVAPLGIGRHVDHLVVRQAAEALQRPLWYYADIPYFLHSPEDLEPQTQGMEGVLFHLSFWGKKAWFNAAAAYRSQIPELFGSEEEMRKALQEYVEREDGVRLWHKVG